MRSFEELSRRIEESTPEDRDRAADLYRVAAIALVVLGHWVVAVIEVDDGELVPRQLLQVVPQTQPLTWLFQVMPVFFFVGGKVNAGSWARARTQREPWAVWVRRRSRRLLGPMAPLLALWIPLALILGEIGVEQSLVARAAEMALLPLWFLVVYLLVIALVPATLALHRRIGWWGLLGALVLIVVVDRLELAGVPLVGYANYLLVWGGAHQLGYLWADGRLPRSAGRMWGLAALAFAVTLALVRWGGYPSSMVAVWGEDRHNTDPPTVALAVFACVQFAVLMAIRPHVERWLQRSSRYVPVVVAGSVVLTVFVWHMTALVVVASVTYGAGLWPETAGIDTTWWLLRPVWVALCALVLAALVTVFRRFEELRDPLPRPGRLRAALGVLATLLGLAAILIGGVYVPERAANVPVVAIAVLGVGLAVLGVLTPARRHPDHDERGD
jgi:hypothetical protein